MRESSFWNTLRRALNKTPGLDMERVENSVALGTPDINLCYQGREAWVELKLLDGFPKREGTPVRIKHFKEEQRLWLKRRHKAGGLCWLFVQVRGEGYFLFHPLVVDRIGEMTQTEWWIEAHRAWSGNCLWAEWLMVVTGGK